MAGIKPYLHGLLEEYARYRGKNHKCPDFKPFWDAVVMTTTDNDQQMAFLQQVEDKRQRGELPKGLPIHVIADPPGVRIGNGGSTMTVLEKLESEYSLEGLFSMKILLIHAGGWSQRMPSCTVLGKIFSVLPYGTTPFQMLDVKLALYWPFVEKIKPGIFLVCADDFSIYTLGCGDLKDATWDIPRLGFTALAHPSPMKLGRAHGVYVVQGADELDFTQLVLSRKCVEVLQKPSDERMRSQGAVLKSSSSSTSIFGDGIKIEGDVVYTDSSFYFGTDIVKRLLDLKKALGELTCEIDAYGDFLQAVGEAATEDYVHDVSNVSRVSESLVETRKKVFHALKGADINLVLLNSSAYIHIGTAKELICYVCRDREFQDRMGFQRDVFNAWVKIHETENDSKKNENEPTPAGCRGDDNCVNVVDKKENNNKINFQNVSDYSCIIHSSINCRSKIGNDSYVEFCDFEMPVEVSGNSVVSNCKVSRNEKDEENERDGSCVGVTVNVGNRDKIHFGNKNCDSTLTIPENTFLHTIPIFSQRNSKYLKTTDEVFKRNSNGEDDGIKNENGVDGNNTNRINTETKSDSKQTSHTRSYVTNYVTVMSDIDDSMKKSVSISELGTLPFNGSDINQFLSQRSLTIDDILPTAFNECQNKYTFTMTESSKDMAAEEKDENPRSKIPKLSGSGCERKISLWDLKLYPAFPTMTASFCDAVKVKQGHRVRVKETSENPVEYHSLSKLLTLKDVKRMLSYRKNLYDKIKESHRLDKNV